MPAPSREPLPTRLVARQVVELLMARSRRWLELIPRERLAGMVFEVVLSGSLSHLPNRQSDTGRWIGLEDAPTLGRPVNATAIAHSMGLPETTVRRRAAELVDGGLLVRGTTGFTIAAGFFADDRVARAFAEDRASLIRVLGALAETGYEPAAAALDAQLANLPPGIVGRLLLAFGLRALETFVELYGDVTTGTILAAIVAINIRHITQDPELALLYSDEDSPPPDSLRTPVTLRALASAIEFPFETVRRRVSGLVADGEIVWRETGVIVPGRVLTRERLNENNRRILLHFEQMLGTLASLAAHCGGRGEFRSSARG